MDYQNQCGSGFRDTTCLEIFSINLFDFIQLVFRAVRVDISVTNSGYMTVRMI